MHHICNTCEKHFKTKYDLNRHENKKNKCKLCEKSKSYEKLEKQIEQQDKQMGCY